MVATWLLWGKQVSDSPVKRDGSRGNGGSVSKLIQKKHCSHAHWTHPIRSAMYVLGHWLPNSEIRGKKQPRNREWQKFGGPINNSKMKPLLDLLKSGTPPNPWA